LDELLNLDIKAGKINFYDDNHKWLYGDASYVNIDTQWFSLTDSYSTAGTTYDMISIYYTE
jgi:uncharacterized protein YxjI